jgi:hypothetical protein
MSRDVAGDKTGHALTAADLPYIRQRVFRILEAMVARWPQIVPPIIA